MNFVDLTHKLYNGMPVFSDEEIPHLKRAAEVENDGYNMTYLGIFSHNGTHMDAPAHVAAEGKTLEEYGIDKFIGRAIVIDCTDVYLREDPEIDFKYIEENKERIEEADFVIFYTGYCRRWGRDEYMKDCPYLSVEAAEYIASKKKKGVGADLMSLDKMDSEDLPIHNILLGNDVLIIENLAHLDEIISSSDGFMFSALPLKYNKADGAQVRAVAQFE